MTNLNITGGAEQGINGNAVSNFALSNSSIVDVGNGPDEDGIHFFNMSGTSSITNTTFNCTVVTHNTTGGDDHINLQMQSGTLNLTISGGSATNANKGSGYLMGIRGTANATVTVDGVTSDNNFSGGIVIDTFDTATSVIEIKNSSSINNNDAISLSSNNGNTKFDIHDNVSFAGTDFVTDQHPEGGVLDDRDTGGQDPQQPDRRHGRPGRGRHHRLSSAATGRSRSASRTTPSPIAVPNGRSTFRAARTDPASSMRPSPATTSTCSSTAPATR